MLLYFLTLTATTFVLVNADEIYGEIFAFADINYDRFTDLIVKRANNIVVYKSVTNEKDLKFTEKTDFIEDRDYTLDFSKHGDIENVAVADFNGDSFSDLLVTTRFKNASDQFKVTICWGTLSSFHPCEFNKYTFREQPIVMNCDDDKLSDFFGIETNLNRSCYLGQVTTHLFEKVQMPSSNKIIMPGTAMAFVDITGDLNADLVIPVGTQNWHEAKSLPELEVWTRNGSGVSWTLQAQHQIPAPPLSFSSLNSSAPPLLSLSDDKNKFTTGHVIFDDWNRDGSPDALIPVCIGPKSALCQNFRIVIWSGEHQRWFWLDVNNMPGSGSNLFANVNAGTFGDNSMTVRSGDYTQNGYPDLLAVLTIEKKDTSRAYVIQSSPCKYDPGTSSPPACVDYGRSFRLEFQPLTPTFCNHVTTSTFFDLKEDGTLNVLYDCYNESTQTHTILFNPGSSNQDTTFLKVQAYTPGCSRDCPNGKEGTGISWAGASFTYRMQDTDGLDISATYTQQSRTSHKSLMLPYALFGLGRTPNFVDRLILGVPQWPTTTQVWPQIVPNSRMYVIPYPAKEPSHWIGRLYVTPNRLVLLSVAALGGVCLLIGIMVVILHCCEMRQDKAERDVLKKRFHFDAM